MEIDPPPKLVIWPTSIALHEIIEIDGVVATTQTPPLFERPTGQTTGGGADLQTVALSLVGGPYVHVVMLGVLVIVKYPVYGGGHRLLGVVIVVRLHLQVLDTALFRVQAGAGP